MSWLIVAALLTGSILLAQEANDKLSPELRKSALSGYVDVIVQFDQTPTEAYHQKVISRGGQLKAKLDFIKAALYRMPAAALTDLASDPCVKHISMDHSVSAKQGRK